MPAPATAEELIEIIRKSGVVDEDKVTKAIKSAPDFPSDPKRAASFFIEKGLITNFQSEQFLQGKWKRFTIGKYRVLERIGSGGMGQVFLCEHKLMRRRVAIKVLPTIDGQDPSSLERFYREARAVAAVDHPNIVRAYDIDQDENLHFLVMEYVDGVNLQDLVKKIGPLPIARACHYVAATCVGLQHAHDMGLVHRDIKPGNILVDRSGVVKILDMGLARFFDDEEESVTRKYDENVLGTADYLSPEQAIDSHSADIRADIYALGGTFYFLLTGQPPFPKGSVTQKLLWHQQQEPESISKFRPDVPSELLAIITKMMAKKLHERFQKPADVFQALLPWTAEVIPLPTAEELPKLSLAAQGSGGPISSRVSKVVQPLSDPHRMNRQIDTFSGSLTDSSASTPTITPNKPSVSSGNNSGSTTSPAALTNEPSENPLDFSDLGPSSVTSNIAPASATKDLPTTKVGSSKPAKVSRVGQADVGQGSAAKLRKSWIIAASLLALILIVGVIFLMIPRGTNLSLISSESVVWYVTKRDLGTSQDRTVPTLAAAIEKAGINETILLMDPSIDDPPLRLSDAGKNAKRGLTIRPGPDLTHVVWMPRFTAARGNAVFEAVYIENLTIEGIIFELAGQADGGIAVGFNCPGLSLKQITIKNPRNYGIRLQQLNGEADRPIRVTDCRIVMNPTTDAGLLITSGNQFLELLNNRIEGPGITGLRIDGQVQNCRVTNQRFYELQTGVHLSGKLASAVNYSLVVEQSTFYAISNYGITSEHLLGFPNQTFELTRNLFVKVNSLVRSQEQAIVGLRAASNGYTNSDKLGSIDSKQQFLLNQKDLQFNMNRDDPNFLAGGQILREIGAGKIVIGYQANNQIE